MVLLSLSSPLSRIQESGQDSKTFWQRSQLLTLPRGYVTDGLNKRSTASRPETWPDRWARAFQTFNQDKFVRLEMLGAFLELAGHQQTSVEESRTMSQVIHQIIGNRRSPLYIEETFDFLVKFEERVVKDLRNEFFRRAVNGYITFAQVEDFAFDLGFTPLPHSLQEVLEEAAKCTGEDIAVPMLMAPVSQKVFERFLTLLVDRDGFSRVEARALHLAFRRFDRDSNGSIDVDEVPPIICWLGFCTDPTIVSNAAADSGLSKGKLTLEGFMALMRRHRELEYNYTLRLFERFDGDSDGCISATEMMRLFRHLGLPLSPEALLEVVEDCDLDPERFTFSCFWKALELLRHRAGLSSADLKEAKDAFRRFDRNKAGVLSTRKLPHALRWLGFLLCANSLESVDWQKGLMHPYVTQVEFLKIVQDHTDASLELTRRVFRGLARQNGQGPMRLSKLPAALKLLNHSYLGDYQTWLQNNMPEKWLQKGSAAIDFHHFRQIVRGCRAQARERLRRNSGFLDDEVASLRVNFQTHDPTGSGCISAAGLQELLRSLFPSLEESRKLHVLMRQALSLNNCTTSGLDWPTFLAVIRSYQDLLEEEQARGARIVMERLNVPIERLDTFMDIYQKYLSAEFGHLTAKDMRTLMSCSVPDVENNKNSMVFTDIEVQEMHDKLVESYRKQGTAGTVEEFITLIENLSGIRRRCSTTKTL